MVTKNIPHPPQNQPGKPAPSKQNSNVRDSSNSSGGRILSENQRQTTVFQTRPTPPDPNKK